VNTIYFNLLKYIHSPFLGEEVNVGILLYFPEQERMEFRFPESSRRLALLYPNFSARQLRSYQESFSRRVARTNAELKQAPSLDHYASFITRELLPADATALQFGSLTKAIAHLEDPAAVADHYYELYFGSVAAPVRSRRKDDGFLLSRFRRLLAETDPAAVRLVRRDVEVVAPKTSVRFDMAWQNGTLNHVKALSFDLSSRSEINHKSVYSHGWLDLLAEVAQNQNYSFDLLVAPPSQRELYGEYEKALSILQGTSAPVRIIEEGKALIDYSEAAARYLINFNDTSQKAAS